MIRREFLARSVVAAGIAPFLGRRSHASQVLPAMTPVASAAGSRLTFETTDATCHSTYTSALETLGRNVTRYFAYAEPPTGPEPTRGTIRLTSGRERTFSVSPNEHVAVQPL